MSDTISFEVETLIPEGVNARRFRWRLKAPGEPEQKPSADSFATRREAVLAGEAAVQRAIQKGRIGR